MKELKLIIAQDLNGGIGYNNKLPWCDKEEIELFKRLTMNHMLIMGRKTYDSLPRTTLKNRTIIVVTRSPEYYNDKPVITAISPQKALDISRSISDKPIFVCGGKQVYEALLPQVTTICRSVFRRTYPCDTYVDLNLKQFNREGGEKFKNFDYALYTNKDIFI